MISRFARTFLLASLVSCAAAEGLKLDSLTVGTLTYSNVTVLRSSATDLYFSHSLGLANVKLKYLTPELQKQFKYDPAVASEVEKTQAEGDHLFQAAFASSLAAQRTAAVAEDQAAGRTSEASLCDPVSPASALGRVFPPLEPDQWVADKPGLDGRSVLVFFWEPWSIPCRKAIPDLSALQRSLGGAVVVVGVCSEPEARILEAAGPKLGFPFAIDAKARIRVAADVTSIPSVQLRNAGGKVLYQGHPGALTEAKVRALLAQSPD